MVRRIRTWGRTRAGAQRVTVYNEGLCAFFYDESRTAALEADGGLADAGERATAWRSEALRRLAEAGTAVVCELPGDDPIALEIVVGPPLTDDEMASLPWLRPQQALLHLPSGQLRVDSFDTLPPALYLRPPYPPPSHHEPGRARVPPGDYVLTLHRIDGDAVERRRGLEIDGPGAVVTLTPLAAAPRPPAAALLEYAGSADLRWPGRYTTAGNLFRGLASFEGDQLLLNLDRVAADRLGLRAGMGLRIAVPELGIVIAAFLADDQCVEGITPPRRATVRAMRAHTDAPPAEKRRFPRDSKVGEWVRAAEWYSAMGVRLPEAWRSIEFLRFFRLGTATRVPGKRESVWLAVEAHVLPVPDLPASYLARIAEP